MWVQSSLTRKKNDGNDTYAEMHLFLSHYCLVVVQNWVLAIQNKHYAFLPKFLKGNYKTVDWAFCRKDISASATVSYLLPTGLPQNNSSCVLGTMPWNFCVMRKRGRGFAVTESVSGLRSLGDAQLRRLPFKTWGRQHGLKQDVPETKASEDKIAIWFVDISKPFRDYDTLYI